MCVCVCVCVYDIYISSCLYVKLVKWCLCIYPFYTPLTSLHHSSPPPSNRSGGGIGGGGGGSRGSRREASPAVGPSLCICFIRAIVLELGDAEVGEFVAGDAEVVVLVLVWGWSLVLCEADCIWRWAKCMCSACCISSACCTSSTSSSDWLVVAIGKGGGELCRLSSGEFCRLSSNLDASVDYHNVS